MSLPRDPSKYDKKSFFDAQFFLNYLKKQGRLPKYKIPQNIIFFFIPTQLPKFDGHKSQETKKFFNARMDLIAKKNIGIVSNFGFGAPALAIQLELLIALGAKNFIGVGTSGSLLEGVEIGDFILCSKALRDEGVSFHYVPPSEYSYPSERLSSKIRKVLKKRDCHFHEAASWTTDAIYRETLEEIRKYRAMGIQTVDMEASALFAIARYRGVEAASLFAISDLLTGDEWSPHLHKTAVPLKLLLDVAIETLNQ